MIASLLVSAAWRTCCNSQDTKLRVDRHASVSADLETFLPRCWVRPPRYHPQNHCADSARSLEPRASLAGPRLRSGRSFVSHYVQPPVRLNPSWPFQPCLTVPFRFGLAGPSASTPARTHGILGDDGMARSVLGKAGRRPVSQPPAPGLSSVSLDGAAADDWSSMRLILEDKRDICSPLAK